MGLNPVLGFRALGRNRQKKEVARAKRKAAVEEGGDKERRRGQVRHLGRVLGVPDGVSIPFSGPQFLCLQNKGVCFVYVWKVLFKRSGISWQFLEQ